MSYLSNLINKGDVEKVKQLITKNKILIKESHGTIVLSQAICEDKFEIVKLLIEHGVEVNDEDKVLYPHEIPIAQASRKGHLQTVKLLLDSGAKVSPSYEDPEYWTPLMCAVSSGSLDIVKLLVKAGADVNEIRDAGNFALYIAACSNFKNICDYLAPLSDSKLRKIAKERESIDR